MSLQSIDTKEPSWQSANTTMALFESQFPYGQPSVVCHDLSIANSDTEMLDIKDAVGNVVLTSCSTEQQNLLRTSLGQDGLYMTQHQSVLPTIPLSSQKLPTREEWEYRRETITALYREQKRGLKEVVDLMAKQYGFKANERMYKKRITDWDIRRNLRWSEREEVSKVIRQKNLLLHANATIVVNGQEKKIALFTRHMKQARRRSQAIRSQQQRFTPIRNDTVPLAGFKGTHKQMRHIFSSQPCLQDVMYPPGDSRLVEIMCHQVSHVCERISDNSLQLLADNDLYQTLNIAMENAASSRYREARVLINEAADCFRQQTISDPYLTLLNLINCLRLRSNFQPNHFNAFELFHEHALELSVQLHGPHHPTATVLSLFIKLEDGEYAIQCAFRCALMSIKAISPKPVFAGVRCWLRSGLALLYQDSGDLCKAECLLVDNLEESKNDRYDSSDRLCSFYELGRYYAQNSPCKYRDARDIFTDILLNISGLSRRSKYHYSRYLAYHGLASLSRRQGKLYIALKYQRLCFAAATCYWGGGNYVLEAAHDLARLLEEQRMMDEAEDTRNMVKITDLSEEMNTEKMDIDQPHIDTYVTSYFTYKLDHLMSQRYGFSVHQSVDVCVLRKRGVSESPVQFPNAGRITKATG